MKTVLITGASGLIGKNFIDEIKEKYRILAIARRSQSEVGIPQHRNINWMMGDIGEKDQVERIFSRVVEKQEVDFVFHFAGYYDFTLKPSPEYERTNVIGTENILEACRTLNIKRFIFSSSLLVSDFAEPGHVITELSPANANNPYAISKRKAEELVAKYSDSFPVVIVRLAAVFTDWCEYGPLYMLINMWLSQNWKKRFILGKGFSALPYIHIKELNIFWNRLMEIDDKLSDVEVLIASCSGCVDQNDIYRISTEYYQGEEGKPVHMPTFLGALNIIYNNIKGVLLKKPVFEKLWMLKYIDKRMDVDPSYTYELLNWYPRYRYSMQRRLLLIVENMRRNPIVWKQRNFVMAHKTVSERPGLKLYNALIDLKEEIIDEHISYLLDSDNKAEFPYYQSLNPRDLRDQITFITQMWEAVILNGDRLHILDYARFLAKIRFKQGYSLHELMNALQHLAYLIEIKLKSHPSLEGMEQRIYHEIVLTMHLIIDEIEEVQEQLAQGFGFDEEEDEIDENTFLM